MSSLPILAESHFSTLSCTSRDPCKPTSTTYTLLDSALGDDGEVLIMDKASIRVAHWAQSSHAHPVMGESSSSHR